MYGIIPPFAVVVDLPRASKSKLSESCWWSVKSWPAASRERSVRKPSGGRFGCLGRASAPYLGDIHGQHDQQLLFIPDAQRDMLDAFAANREPLERAAALFFSSSAARRRNWEELERSEQEKLRLLDLWSFQRKEIESAALGAEEDISLENERRVLQNVQTLEEAVSNALRGGSTMPWNRADFARPARGAPPGRTSPYRPLH